MIGRRDRWTHRHRIAMASSLISSGFAASSGAREVCCDVSDRGAHSEYVAIGSPIRQPCELAVSEMSSVAAARAAVDRPDGGPGRQHGREPGVRRPPGLHRPRAIVRFGGERGLQVRFPCSRPGGKRCCIAAPRAPGAPAWKRTRRAPARTRSRVPGQGAGGRSTWRDMTCDPGRHASSMIGAPASLRPSPIARSPHAGFRRSSRHDSASCSSRRGAR